MIFFRVCRRYRQIKAVSLISTRTVRTGSSVSSVVCSQNHVGLKWDVIELFKWIWTPDPTAALELVDHPMINCVLAVKCHCIPGGGGDFRHWWGLCIPIGRKMLFFGFQRLLIGEPFFSHSVNSSNRWIESLESPNDES